MRGLHQNLGHHGLEVHEVGSRSESAHVQPTDRELMWKDLWTADMGYVMKE